ncbi:MAG: peptide/nickel transport system substrate-binding protein, partial [Sphingomonadales bacterium]|nr:peptide/nickel transport system substrate-binding protein [Sphingomonadales bacterium]
MKHLMKITIAAALFAGFGTAALAVERGGVLNYGRYADSLFLDPVLNDANVDIWILSNIYDTLLLPTDDGKGVEPGLASEWKVADDGTSVTLTLREGIKFSDGTPITAEDVQWSLKRAANPDNGIWGFLLASVQDVVIQDDKTILLQLKQADPAIVSALSVFNTQILPKHAFEAAPGSTDEEKAKAYAEHPVSSGPFVLESWQRGSEMRLVRNPNYWRQGEDGQPLPYLDGISFQVIPEDATRLLKIKAGE